MRLLVEATEHVIMLRGKGSVQGEGEGMEGRKGLGQRKIYFVQEWESHKAYRCSLYFFNNTVYLNLIKKDELAIKPVTNKRATKHTNKHYSPKRVSLDLNPHPLQVAQASKLLGITLPTSGVGRKPSVPPTELPITACSHLDDSVDSGSSHPSQGTL